MKLFAAADIRVRLAAWFALGVLLLYGGLMALTVVLVRHHAQSAMDRRLQADLGTAADLELLAPAATAGAAAMFDLVETGQATIDRWVVDETTGALLLRRRLRGQDAAPVFAPDGQGLEPGAMRHAYSPDRQWRMAYTRLNVRAGASVLLLAAQPMEPILRLQQTLVGQALIGLMIAPLLACGAGWLLAGRALAPVRAITRATQAIGPSDLHRRLHTGNRRDELAELSEVINGLLERVQSALRREAFFATEAAHELRTPLTSQRALGELALRGRASADELREAISSMLEEGEHMHKLVDSLLLLARAEGGLLPRPEHPLEARQLADRCVRSLQPLAEEDDKALTLEPGEAVWVLADETVLRQALLNLMHNAIQHSPPGTRVWVSVSGHGDRVHLDVHDDGPGFDDAAPPRLVRHGAAPQDPSRRRGLGVGLSIAHALVRSQSGRLRIQSKIGEGTRAMIDMPAAQVGQLRPLGVSAAFAARHHG